jgi:hypothetical protein
MATFHNSTAIFNNVIFDASKDIVITIDYVATPAYIIGGIKGGFVVGVLPYYRVAPDNVSVDAGLGYSNFADASATGIADAQLGIGFDFNGYFSTSATGTFGLSAPTPNSICVRGPASLNYPFYTVSPDLATLATPFTLYSGYTTPQSKRLRVRLTDFGTHIIVDGKNATDTDFIRLLDYRTTQSITDYVRVYCACDYDTVLTRVSIQNINVNGYNQTLNYTYSGAWYLGLTPNPATFTETQLLSVVNVYPASLNKSLSSIGPLILINNANSGAPYVADNVSTSQRFVRNLSAGPQDSFIFISYQ